MIYDAILYNGEKELLEIRLHEMKRCNGHVQHVIIEASRTHTGKIKPLYFLEHKHEFSEFDIFYFVVDDLPSGTARELEKFQRNRIMTALDIASPKDEDIVIVADVDEIPRAEQLNKFRHSMEFAALIQNKYAYFLNVLESEQSWDRARIMLYGYLKDKEPEIVRNSGYDFSIHFAGWHFSWVVDPLRKLQSFSHTELNTMDNISKAMKNENFWNNDELKTVEIDLSYPEYLYRNQEKFKHLIK